MVQYGFGHHLLGIPVTDRVEALFLYWVSQILYKISLQLTKISLLLFYKRIFGTVKWFKHLSTVLVVALIVYAIVSCVTGMAQCNPVARAWNRAVDGTCINLTQFFIANGAFATITDIVILIMPLPLVWGLMLPMAQKIALVPIFGLGIFIVIVSTMRLAALISTTTSDITYDLMGTLWTIIEYNLAIVCASLPTVRILLVRFFPNQFGSKSGSTEKRATMGPTSNSRSTKASDPSNWSGIEVKDGINLTTIHAGEGSGSEVSILEATQQAGISRTIEYSVK
jgi:hypothetical protein